MYTRSIIKFLFLDDFYRYFIKMENKMNQLMAGLKFEFEFFFKVTIVILGLSRLIYDDLLLDLLKLNFVETDN